MTLVEETCPACGDTKASLVHRTASTATSTDFKITTDVFGAVGTVVQCRGCSLVFRSPPPTATDVNAAYEDMSDEEYLSEIECRHMNAQLALRTLRRFSSGGRLLEVGCATGFFLNAARYDFEVQGVEPSSWAADVARKKWGLPVLTGTIADVPPAMAEFDAVCALDVLEHVPEVGRFVAALAHRTKIGGVLYLVTPNIESLSARLLGRYWWGLRPAHLTYFSPKSLGLLLEKNGFEVVWNKSYGRIFTYGYWLSRVKNYPWVIRFLLGTVIRFLGIEEKVVYIDTRDSMEICAVRRR
jgi:SAM-dependent methyltransferase